VEAAYRCVLGRSPTPDEREYFLRSWQERTELSRKQQLEDLFWVLLNSSEFSWNH
jgi:hypothetical protein